MNFVLIRSFKGIGRFLRSGFQDTGIMMKSAWRLISWNPVEELTCCYFTHINVVFKYQ